jgi:hypothetical protein
MIVRGFKSVIWVATVGGAALACYMVSLQVATERAELAKVERQIIAAKQDIRSLQTELGTRGRLSQLEQWNAEVLALAAPSSAQFLSDQVKLARFERHDPTLDERSAEIRMAALHTGDTLPAVAAKPPVVRAMAPAPAPVGAATPTIHRASFTTASVKPTVLAASKPAAEAPKLVAAAASSTSAPRAPARADARTVKAESKPVPAKVDAPAARADLKVAAKAPSEKVRTSRIDSRLAEEIKTGLRKGQGSGGN